MRRFFLVAGLAVLAVLLIAAGVVYSWTFVPHGRLDLESAIFLKLAAPRIPSPGSVPVEVQRERFKAFMMALPGRETSIERIETHMITGTDGQIPVRLYWPNPNPSLPVLVYFHGGAFRVGDLDTHDHICRTLSLKASVLVVSVDYRLAPEHPFPAAVEDCYSAVEWVLENAAQLYADQNRIAVGGDSAGGNLAAVTAIKARNLGHPSLVFQLLIYPVIDMSSYDTLSWRALGNDYLLTRKAVEVMRESYVSDPSNRTHQFTSPLLAESHRDLPPALVVTAEFDPLRDEGEAYVRKLQSAGVPARHIRYTGVLHGFYGITVFRKGRQALEETAAVLKDALHGGI